MNIGIFAKTVGMSSRSSGVPGETNRKVSDERELIPALFRTIAGYGIYSVQFNLACAGIETLPAEAPPDELIQRIIAAAKQAKVELSAISGTFNMAHPDPELRRTNLLKFEVLCEVSTRLQIPTITLCTGTRDPADMWKWHPDNDSKAAWDDMVRSIQIALVAAERYNLALAFEPERENIVNSAQRARKLLDDLATPRLRIIIDPANLIFPGYETLPQRHRGHEVRNRPGILPERHEQSGQREVLDDAFAQLADAITIAHAKDRDHDFNPCAAGKGILDFPYYIRCLKQSGFNGPFILHGLKEEEVPFSRQFLEDLLTQGNEAHEG